MDFPRAHAFTPGDTAYDQSASFPGRGARGTYVPPQGGSFAWRTDEWYLAPETLMPTKGRAGASEHVHDPSSAARVVGSALTAPLVAAPPVRAPPGPLEPSPGARGALPGDTTHDGGIDQAVPGRVPGGSTPGGPRGTAPLGRRRKGAAPRACSAVGCSAHVLDRAQGLVVMCPAHRRVTSGVAVDTGDGLMRWCYHCKKAHKLGAFADSVIGLSRKLATCERGRAARRAAFAKKAADGARDGARAAIEGTPNSVGGSGDAHSGDGPSVPSSQTDLLTAETTGRANAREEPAGRPNGATIVPALRAGAGHAYRIKSEAATLAAVASARARGRPKRQQDLLDANPSRSGSPAHERTVSGSHGSGSHGSLRAEPAFEDIGNAPVPNERNGTAAPGHWPLRAFEEVAFEVSTRAAPAELIGDKHSVFEQMAGFVSRAVLSDAADPRGEANANANANANPWTSDGSGSAVDADQFLRSNEPIDADAGGETLHDRHARAVDAVRREGANFFMGLGEVQSLLDANEAEASFESSEPQNDMIGEHAKAAAMSRGWFDALAATILPGSTRVICTTRAGFPGSRRRGSHPDAATLARAMPPGGALGRRTATVTAHPNVRVGAGWIWDDDDDSPLDTDSRQKTQRADSVVVACSESGLAESGLTREKARVTPFPSYVTVSPVAAMGDYIVVGGLRGGERVHVFGQGARPFSAVVPRGVDAVRIAPPRLAVGASGAPGIVPGFVYVQVLAPGQPATGSTFVKVLLVDDPAVLAELDALGRGAGALRASLVPAGVGSALPAARGFVGPAAFERFLNDLGALLESHWRSLLYTLEGRAATRVVAEGFDAVVAGAAFPALRAALADVVEDVDAQRLFENDASRDGVVAENGFGVFATDLTSSRLADESLVRSFGLFDENVFQKGFFSKQHAERRRRRSRSRSSNGRHQESPTPSVDVWSWTLLERASRANIASTRDLARDVLAAVATRLAPSRATRLALRAVLDNRSDIARRVFSCDEVDAMSPQTRVSLYCHSMMVVSLILLVAMFRAEGWGTTPLSLLGCYVPTFPVLLLYCVGTRDARVLRWAQNRSWMMGSGGALLDDSEPPSAPDYRARRLRAVRHSHAHDFFMMMLLMACNGAVRYLTLEEGRAIERAREWIHGALMLFGNSIMYAVYSAEFVRPGRKRLDIPAVVIAGAALYGCPPNAWAKLARAPSPASAAAELFLLQTHLDAKMAALSFFAVPCLAAALARRACRVHNRLALFAKVDAAAMVDPAEANAKRTS